MEDFVAQVSEWTNRALTLIGQPPARLPLFLLDVAIVALIFWWLYILIRQTRAFRILLGLAILALVALLSRLLGLETLNFLMRHLATALIVAIPIVFQPELRSALERLGRMRLPGERRETLVSPREVVDEIVRASEAIRQRGLGALIVIARKTGLRDIAETGVIVAGRVSSDLLEAIFQKTSPLHDGAVVIQDGHVLAARALLPVDEGRSQLGLRHRSALAISRETDAVALVISEEEKTISLAVEGELKRDLSPFDLRAELARLFQVASS